MIHDFVNNLSAKKRLFFIEEGRLDSFHNNLSYLWCLLSYLDTPYLKEMRDNYRIKGENILTLFLLFEVFDILCDPFS